MYLRMYIHIRIHICSIHYTVCSDINDTNICMYSLLYDLADGHLATGNSVILTYIGISLGMNII